VLERAGTNFLGLGSVLPVTITQPKGSKTRGLGGIERISASKGETGGSLHEDG
jgi:hypothetical protein